MPELIEINTNDIIKILRSDENISDELKKELYKFIENKENVYKLFIDMNKFLYLSELIKLYNTLNIELTYYYKK